MKLVLQITCGLLLLAVCASATQKLKSKSRDDDENDSYPDKDPPRARHHKKQLDDEINLNGIFNLEQLGNKQLPILPPIILLDFVNGTDYTSTNVTNQSDEKSKRTIDDSLGYGFNTNSLFSGKHNFYFPAGKTGTAVSIEESISPFEPKTVTEIIKPITEKTDVEEVHKPQKTLFEALPDPLPLQNHEPLPIYPPYPIFGQRTKLQKTSSSDFDIRSPGKLHSGSYSTPMTPVAGSYNKLLTSYMPAKPVTHASLSDFVGSPNVHRYARPMTSSYLANYVTGKYGSQKMSVNTIPNLNTNSNNNNNQEINLADYPKFTIENGIRYEHKIIWKYPDGKISETPPMAYSDYADNTPKLSPPQSVGGFRPSLPPPLHPRLTTPTLPTGYNPYNTRAQNNIYSPRPVQFPNDQESSNGSKQQSEPSRFVSTASASAFQGSDFETANTYNLEHQGQYGMRYSPKLVIGHRPAVSYNHQHNSYANNHHTAKFPINSMNTEYTYSQEHAHSGNLFSSDGLINKHVLAKYTPEVQSYLAKIFSEKRIPMHEYQGDEDASYANTEFSSLLNYNPSISQYIKNPSAILKAQPTFIQTGSSLIPVIILRVDGTPPIQMKSGTNINLKSLLRQYLTQYANSVSKVSQNTNYKLGGAINDNEASKHTSNPVEDLKQLTNTLESLRQRGHQDPDFLVGSYSHNNAQQSYTTQRYNSGTMRDHSISYSEFVKDSSKANNEQERKRSQKVKSVQIIEDPRYTTYKVNNNNMGI